MDFDVAKLLWQIVNFLILIGMFALVFLIPIKVFKRIKAIEGQLEQINRKLEVLEENRKN